ncbi:putative Adrenodoxin [Daphnia magna]|uniref:Putative Adrenodoxin n=1 Tax=Daphnia magna TaxID=35525 RepID=A0A164X6Z6_9CRUS|nr:putative Adrenodoxin [Daphnia magna]
MLRIINKLRVPAQRSLMMLCEKSNVSRSLASDVRYHDRRSFCHSLPSFQKKMISVTFVNREGACEGTLSCSTCHIIFKKEDFDKLPEKPSDEEMDMLDLAYGLCDTSRLGCQITLTESMDGIVVTVPAQVADARDR